MKVAIIGCGTIANSAHIPAYIKNPEAEIAYFCDIRKERADAAVEKYGCGKAVADYHEVLNDPTVEAVSVCTPNNMHPVIAIDCLRAGKNVLCEKPAAKTYAEALEMQRVAHETGKVLNIGVVNRFNNGVQKIKQYIDAGDLGEVYQVYVSFRSHRSIPGIGGQFTTKEISGGGALIDWGVHFLDVVMYCCSDPLPLTVTGETFSKLGVNIPEYAYKYMWALPTADMNGTYDVEDAVTGMIRTEGPVITLNGAWAQNIKDDEMYIDFLGTKAGIRLHYGKTFDVFKSEHGALVSYTPDYNSTDMFENEINAFVNCIKTGEKLPSNIDTVVITAKMMQAIYDSAEKHREIVLEK